MLLSEYEELSNGYKFWVQSLDFRLPSTALKRFMKNLKRFESVCTILPDTFNFFIQLSYAKNPLRANYTIIHKRTMFAMDFWLTHILLVRCFKRINGHCTFYLRGTSAVVRVENWTFFRLLIMNQMLVYVLHQPKLLYSFNSFYNLLTNKY